MNTRGAHPAHPRIRRRRGPVTRIATIAAPWLTLIGGSSTGCIDIDGGAAEVSWSLRSADGDSIEACQDVDVRDVRLCWEAVADGSVLGGGGECQSGQRRSFPCGESSGVTGFNLDPGRTAFWIEPVCIDGDPADAGTYQVPPPIVRTVEDGEIVSLNSLLLVVNPTDGNCPSAGCTCVRL
jgi:hypothetical protein